MTDKPWDTPNRWLSKALALAEGDTPFPWQEELLARFKNGVVARSLDIPTGLGKTGVMAIWLVARALGAPLPRRLVYVVDRRVVVDQATHVAEGLRTLVDDDAGFKHALGLRRSLPISTLRGQHVDNREWLEDPASPSIIVGTVDMIGSRLLFQGYGVSRRMRPYHAGLLGVDTLVVLDEAHLVPPFESLIETIAESVPTLGSQDESLRKLIPPFKLLSLSATGRTLAGQNPFGLQSADLEHPVVRRRLDAPKHVAVRRLGDQTKLETALAAHAWRLTDNGRLPLRIIVFADKRRVAEATQAAIDKLAKGDKKAGVPHVEIRSELLVGARRVLERNDAAKALTTCGFIAGSNVDRRCASFLFATSAGEVGVDLDADHMVSDVVAWERMVQRLGRVNRRGDGEAQVQVVTEPPSKESEKARVTPAEERTAIELTAIAEAESKDAVLQLIDRLPSKNGVRDASLSALRALKLSGASDGGVRRLLDAATTPAPLRPALSRALVDAWSMTSLEEHSGRPEIEPWLRGWIDDPPQTSVVWRRHLPVRSDGRESKKEIEGFFEAAHHTPARPCRRRLFEFSAGSRRAPRNFAAEGRRRPRMKGREKPRRGMGPLVKMRQSPCCSLRREI